MAKVVKGNEQEKPVAALSTKELLDEAQVLKNVILVAFSRWSDVFEEIIVKRLTGER